MKKVINHKNGNPYKNNIINLEIVTEEEKDRIQHQRIIDTNNIIREDDEKE